jgi:hypothetical protein
VIDLPRAKYNKIDYQLSRQQNGWRARETLDKNGPSGTYIDSCHDIDLGSCSVRIAVRSPPV